MKSLALCADDFGLSAPINSGILALARQRRLSDVSCIVNAPAWHAHAATLVATGVRCGLHFNLTEGRPLSPRLAAHWPRLPGLGLLIAWAHLRRLPLEALRDELTLQWAAFEAAAGQGPRHIDGHQHVHHLPGVRGLVLELAARHPGLRVRHTGQVRGAGAGLKGRLIAATGGAAFGRQLQDHGLAQNSTLLGVYDFAATDYRALMQAWLMAAPAEGALLLCHPADAAAAGESSAASVAADPIADARKRECAYLGSAAFAADLVAAGTVLAVQP
jgi:predicted glycoside hydrolase/deacetylase ChbG (UPF0249 family)